MNDSTRAGITFSEIAARWQRIAPLPLSTRPEKLEYYDWLTAPSARAWFSACFQFAHGENSAEQVLVDKACLQPLGDYARCIAEAHLACAEAAQQARWQQTQRLLKKAWEAVWHFEEARENVAYDPHSDSFSYTGRIQRCTPLAWSTLANSIPADEIEPRDNKEPFDKARRLLDRAFRLLAKQSVERTPAWLQYLAEAWSLTASLLGRDRTGDRLETSALVVARVRQTFRHFEEGVVLTLTLERIADGVGVLHPAPEMAFVYRDRNHGAKERAGFRDAEDEAVEHVKGLGLWTDSSDVRWTLRLRGSQRPTLLRLTGPSAGAAFALATAKLLAAR